VEEKMSEFMPHPLIIVCAGGFAADLASYIRAQRVVGEPMFVRAFVDDHRFESTYEGAPLLGGVEDLGAFLAAHPDDMYAYVVAVGDNRTRAEVVRRVERLGATNLTPGTVQHSSALVGHAVEIGHGTCLGPGSIVTTRVVIGNHSIVNTNSSVSHETALGSFVNVNPGASICGGVTIGEGCYIGAGATVVDGIQIGDWSVIEAGSVVIEDVPPHVTVTGSPARIIQRHGRGLRQPMHVG
jgi:acetyltransferase EpsM